MTTQQDRVEQNTPDSLNDEIELQLRDNIRKYATADKSTLSQRIAELEKEWYMDRMLITNASSIAGIGVLLAATVHKKNGLSCRELFLLFCCSMECRAGVPHFRCSESWEFVLSKKLIARDLP